MTHADDQADETPESAATQVEIPSTVAEERTVKRCKDHPRNFPDEDVIRDITEFRMHGKYLSPYCKRCQNIRNLGYQMRRKQRLQTPMVSPAEPAPIRVEEPEEPEIDPLEDITKECDDAEE